MVVHARHREHIVDQHYRFRSHGVRYTGGVSGIGNAWERREIAGMRAGIEPYTREDMLLDQLEHLPSREQVHVVFGLLRPNELREIAEGVVNDAVAASKSGDCLEVAKSINEWIATAEETSQFRRKRRHILAARERQRKQRAKPQ